MAKLSISIPDDLAHELRDEVPDNVSRFVSAAVRDALDRRRLRRALTELEDEFGPLEAEDLAEADEEFKQVESAALGLRKRGRASRRRGSDARARP